MARGAPQEACFGRGLLELPSIPHASRLGEGSNLERYKSIAVLDSGVGGLTVVQEMVNLLPREKIVYFGDTARMPYGPRPQEQVRRFVFEILEFLITQEIKAIVVACNSAAAAGLQHYRMKIDLPLLGVIEPGVRAALQQTRSGKVGVIGTTGTIRSGAYQQAFAAQDPGVEVFVKSCPLFVLLVENNLVNTPEARRVAEEYLCPFKEAGVDTLILGCTHYPLLAHVIQEAVGPGVTLISSAEETAREARAILQGQKLLNSAPVLTARHRFFCSGRAKPFAEMSTRLLKEEIHAFQVILED